MPIAQTRLEILQVHKFLQCVRNQDKPQIEKLCAHGVPHLINYSEPNDGETGLHLAARVNDDDMVKFLLELGAHPNVVDLKGRTAAMRAAEYGHVQTLDVLASAGSDMKIKDAEGKGILFYCILPTSRHAKCTQIVLECGAECNNVANDGMPLLVLACMESVENEKICLQFLENAADPNSAQPSTSKTPLIEAARSGSVLVCRAILAKGGEVNAMDKNKRTAAHMAAKNGHFDVLHLLCSYGANLSLVDTIGNTMIHYTAEGGFANCLKYLSQRGCKANTKNDDGLLPKVIAKNNGFKDVMKECRKAERLSKKLQGGGKAPTEAWAVRLYDWTHENQTRLMEHFQQMDPDGNEVLSKEDFYDILVTLEAPINEDSFKALFLLHDKTKEGVINYHEFLAGKKYVHKTYLMSAFEKKEKKKKGKKGKKKKGKTKVPMPICIGAEGARTENGEPPEHLIHRHVPFTDTGRFDRDHPPDHPIQDDSAWYLHFPEKTYINVTDAAKMTDLDSLRRAYSHGRSVNTQDKYYKTALMVACAQGNLEVARFLLENGADVNCQDNFLWTPLHHACLSGQLDVVELLVAHQANINAQAMNGGTPLMRAIQTSAPDIVKYLIEKGCDVMLENRKGDNALDVAKWWADPRVLEIVQAKFESLPQPKEGKKGKGKKGRGKSGQKKAPVRASSVPPIPQGGMTTQTTQDSPTITPRERKGSVLRAASAMAGGIEHHEDITYIPFVAWSNVPNTRELIVKKEQRRMRFGDGIDFPDFRMPFKDNFMKKSEALGGVDSDDDD
ncbi:ankyrin repeat and EF-hand domain-containing protein 1-like isoform X2 [Acanthaster planci]|uniref:Ankyrin repeat and EF-hand domain-containing protein 1-like isoform X2 n=1 Tax=Acanthaster planci TaxID=133434 RepID=A0A8B7ZT04_ACAPL|nr:ankyrin repeat and EF-hand domain-containing protein 1-like isoform X2 [Acanthaster planci]